MLAKSNKILINLTIEGIQEFRLKVHFSSACCRKTLLIQISETVLYLSLAFLTGHKWTTNMWSNFYAIYQVTYDSARYEVKKLLTFWTKVG